MWFNEYPYKNLTDLNLDFLLRSINELRYQLENFININTIKYANPIQWNITTQYEANTVVIDANDGTAYLSVKPVPSGIALTNTDYWTVIFTLDIFRANQNITLRDDGANVLATFASSENDWLIWNGVLYKVIRAIAVNESYVVGYNLTRYTVELFIKDYINNIISIVGDLNDLTTTDKSSIVNAINELEAAIGSSIQYINGAYVATRTFTDVQDAVEFAHDNNISIVVLTENRAISRPISLYDGMTFDGCNHVIDTISTYDSPRIITNYDSFITNNNVYQKFNSGSVASRNNNITVKNVVIANDWTQSFNGMVNPYPRGPLAFDSVDGLTIVNVTNEKLLDEITIWATRCNDVDVSNCNIESTLTTAGGCVWFFGDTINGNNTYKNFNVHDCVLKCAKDEAVYFSATYGSIENIDVSNCYIVGDQLSITTIGYSNNIDIHDNMIGGGYVKVGNLTNNTQIHNNKFISTTSTYLGVFTQPQDTGVRGKNVKVNDNLFKIGSSVLGSAVSLRYFSNVTAENNMIEMENTTYQALDFRVCDNITIVSNKIKAVRMAYIEGANTSPTAILNNVFTSIDNTRSALEFGASALAYVKIVGNVFYNAGACIANEGGNFEANHFIGNNVNNCTCLFSLNALLSATAQTNKSIMKDNLVLSGALYIDTIGSGTIANDTRIVKFNNYVYVPDGTTTPTWTLTT